jgi:hypothetical protein
MRFPEIHKVCINSQAIVETLKASNVDSVSFVEAECLTRKYGVMLSSDLDEEIFSVKEGDRPFDRPELFRGNPQFFALQRVRNVSYLIWRPSRVANPPSVATVSATRPKD